MFKIGVMQGRLTNKGGFFPQQFPWDNWAKEFFVAKELGFESLEWMFNSERWQENPIVTDDGIESIREYIAHTGIEVSGICANFFMQHNISDISADLQRQNISILNMLIKNAKNIGCKNIILPMFGSSAEVFEKEDAWERVCMLFKQLENDDISILFETDTPMDIVEDFFCDISYAGVGVCYDIGNATGLGKDVLLEQSKYADLIREYHIKDKKYGGSTVMLGQGDTPYSEWAGGLQNSRYQGYLILESYYNVDAVNDTMKNLQFLKDKVEL